MKGMLVIIMSAEPSWWTGSVACHDIEIFHKNEGWGVIIEVENYKQCLSAL